MSTLIWHPDALSDIGRLYDFLFSVNPDAARRAAQSILDGADNIAANPMLGTARAELREWVERFGRHAYILRYRVLSNGDVLVTPVWHSREQSPS